MKEKLKKIFILVSFLMILIVPFRIKVKVECKSQDGNCPTEVTSGLENFSDKNFYSAKKGITKYLKTNYYVSDYSIQFKLPNKISVNTIIKKPVFAVYSKAINKYFLIDSSGVVLATQDTSKLPVVFKDNAEYKPGGKISGDDLFALNIIEGMIKMYQIGSGTVVNDTLLVDMPGSIRVIFPLRDAELSVILGSLRLIYSKISTDNVGKYSQIDLRYKNPILR